MKHYIATILSLLLFSPLLAIADPSDSDIRDAMRRCVKRMSACESSGQVSTEEWQTIQTNCRAEVKQNVYVVDHEDQFTRQCRYSSPEGQGVLADCNKQCGIAVSGGGTINYEAGVDGDNSDCSDNCRNEAWDAIPNNRRKEIEHGCDRQVNEAKEYFSDN